MNDIQHRSSIRRDSGAFAGSLPPALGASQPRTVFLDGAVRPMVWRSKDEFSRASEQYRIIRTRLLRADDRLEVLLVSSPGPGDGKTISATNLAGIFALKGDERVLLVDGDMRRPNVARQLGIEAPLGFSDVLEGRCDFSEAVVQVSQQPNFHILAAGRARSNPAELLASDTWRRLIVSLRATYRWTIIDSPPIATVADYELLELSADKVVMILRPDHTKRSALNGALQLVNRNKLVGVILNSTKSWFGWKTSDYYYGV